MRQDTILSYDGHIFYSFSWALPAMDAKKKRSIQLSELRQIQLFYGHFIDGSVHKQWGVYLLLPDFIRKKEQDQIVFSGTGSLAIQL